MRFSRLYEQTAEFRSRCKAFDFAVVAQAVVEIAIEARKQAAAWFKTFRKSLWQPTKPATPKPVQLDIELGAPAI